ncbi:hypothetical protein H9L13_06330 [Sphingomonas lutea]|uniref:Uncharacterized protein n=1 Tax=Sphingomonas lutea TaxID=1045317 RepID=A0A7G9SES5_9SPHN|nr:DUF6491 family protein [Sphingomonas lutea]QNN66350.1 hypothetical protein H9L13_06330 [Sphingomonas lutea]
MRWTAITLTSLGLATASLAAVAGLPATPSAAQPARQCFNASAIRGFETLPGGLVLMRAGGNRTFALQTLGDCPDLNWARGIGVRTFGGGSWICSGLDAQLVVPSPIGAQYCAVRDVRWISREEARALRQSRRRR